MSYYTKYNSNYYGAGARHPYDDGPTPSPAPYSASPFTPSARSTPAPSYHSGYPPPEPVHSPPLNYPSHRNSPGAGPSPFDSVFDDNAYRADHYPTGTASTMSQYGYYRDPAYYGPGSLPAPSQPQSTENIPLRDHSSKNGAVNDHVFDVPEGRPPRRSNRRKGKIRIGELGMLGADKKRIPWVTYIFTVIQIGVFLGEVIKNGIMTGSPIMIRPQFNPMIGPSTYVMIYMGARYVPCMHNVKEIQGSTIPVLFLCPNATREDQFCPLSELCGFGGVPNPTFNNADQQPEPNQWWRFIIPIFMHAGLIHIGFNMLMQLTIGKEMEKAIGSIRYFLVYMSAGIFGFVMGGNFAAPGVASTGASGSLFGVIALTLLDLLYSWNERRNPVKDLLFVILDMVIAFVLGLLPGLDNFSHIGGFLMGLGLGICVLHSPNALRRRMAAGTPYAAVSADESAMPSFIKSPVGFFKGRKPLWWIWWLVRAAALILVIVVFILLLDNFYKAKKTCDWCKYLSCIPVSNWCELGTIQEQT